MGFKRGHNYARDTRSPSARWPLETCGHLILRRSPSDFARYRSARAVILVYLSISLRDIFGRGAESCLVRYCVCGTSQRPVRHFIRRSIPLTGWMGGALLLLFTAVPGVFLIGRRGRTTHGARYRPPSPCVPHEARPARCAGNSGSRAQTSDAHWLHPVAGGDPVGGPRS